MTNIIQFPSPKPESFQHQLENHFIEQQNHIRGLTKFIEEKLNVKVEEIRFSQSNGKLCIEVLAENKLVIR